ncbi:MAG: outer membrane protein transport protein [Gallionella sp.]
MIFNKTVVSYSVAAALMVMTGSAAASGFALLEQNASGLGNAFAGGAAIAKDASTIFFNPAGMSRLSGKQIVVTGSMIRPSAKFTGTAGSSLAPFQTAGTNGGGDAGSWALVPSGFFAMKVNSALHVGLGINAPFGLQTHYGANWMGRYQGVKSKIETINLNPSVSYDVSDAVSIGAGLNYQRIKGTLTGMTNYPAAIYKGALLAGAPPAAAGGAAAPFAGRQGLSTLTGSDSAWGYNFGVLFKISPQTRVGLAYRSRIKYKLSGNISFAHRPAALATALADQPVTLAITMPDSFSISGFHQMDDKWDFMADATWTGWRVFQQLKVVKANGTMLGAATPENWKNTWRVAVGTSYHYSKAWIARAGLAFDQTPVSTQYRTVRIPDANRTWLTLGGQYKMSKASALDFGYAHLFVKNASLNQNAAANPDLAGKGYLVGNYNNSVDILSMQYSYNF